MSRKPVGQWLTDIRRPGGLGKDPDRVTGFALHSETSTP
jgi:hypothetical protein